MMRSSLTVAVALALAALCGCASSPKSDFYTLSAAAPQTGNPPAVPIAVLIGVVTVPDLVDRPQIVVRSGDNTVDIDEFARWADPLKSQIPRVVRADLGQLLNSSMVSTYPMGGDSASAYRVQLDIQRFDAALGDAVTVDVLWSVAPPGKKPPLSGRSTVHEPCTGAGFDGVVAAYSRALGTVSRDIAVAIRPASP
ncbi:PqiC family protein [Paraburkholderia sediminicola]|uniref:PqiC family protein n=1 Tax=Paraburkholderia sediminicola TaxID=458836 RepID=UPI0038BCD3FD